MTRRSPQVLVELLQSRPMVELSDVQSALDGASRSTVFRYLQQVPYRSSYNHNGRYYTLHDASKYDRWGLFSVGDVHFSKDGTLKATVVRLVRESEAGFTQGELRELSRVRTQLFLLAAFREGSISREAFGRQHVYVATDAQAREAQLEQRRQRAAKPKSATEIDHEMVIRVLLVLLRYPGSLAGDVVRRLQGRSPPVTRTEVDSVFVQYGLDEKGGPRIF